MSKEKTNLQLLSELDMEAKAKQFPNFPKEYIPKSKFSDKGANSLTKAVVTFLQLNRHQAERISTTGLYRDNRKTVTDVTGFRKQIGSAGWTPGSGTKGSADISSTINVNFKGKQIGLSVKWEVKIGKDRQSEQQKLYEENVTKSGGYYYIIRSFDDFIEKYNNLLKEFE